MKIYKYISLCVLTAMSMTGCSDFLDPANPSSGNSDGTEYITSNPESLRATTYNAFSTFATNISLHDQGGDLYINPRAGSDGTYGQYNITTDNSDIKSYYTNAYKAINYANAMIKYNGEDTQLGWEGQFLRAYGYYLLTQQFGDVPYVTWYIQDSSRDYPRTPIAEIYASEINILENLYNNSGLDATNHSGVVSKQAVAALLAYYYLVSGWDVDTTLDNDIEGSYTVNDKTNFAKAAEWAEKAINGVQLTMSFADKWSPFNEGNAEEIFSFQWERQSGVTRAHSLQNDYIAYWGNCEGTGQKGTGSGGTNMPSDKSLYLFEKGDLRWDGTFMNIFYNATAEMIGGTKRANWGTEGYFAYWNCTSDVLADMNIAYKYWPYYVEEEEAEAEMMTIKDRLFMEGDARDPNTLYGINMPECAILTDSDVAFYSYQKLNSNGQVDGAEKILWTIEVPASDGSIGTYGWTKTRKTWTQFYTKADGNGICVKKWDDPASGQVSSGACYRDVPLYHVSDMYLIAAEAYLLAGQDAKALEKLNAVRKRAGLENLASFGAYDPQYTIPSSFTLNSLDLVLDERARELYAERTRWFDLKRTKQLVRYNIAFARSISSRDDMANAKGEVKWLRPIPDAEISANTAMTSADQNPGY